MKEEKSIKKKSSRQTVFIVIFAVVFLALVIASLAAAMTEKEQSGETTGSGLIVESYTESVSSTESSKEEYDLKNYTIICYNGSQTYTRECTAALRLPLPDNIFSNTYSVNIDRGDGSRVVAEDFCYIFAGWSLEDDGTPDYSVGAAISSDELPDGDELKLYACWRNSGYTLPDYKRSGYHLVGWSDGTDIIGKPGDSVILLPDMTLKCVWAEGDTADVISETNETAESVGTVDNISETDIPGGASGYESKYIPMTEIKSGTETIKVSDEKGVEFYNHYRMKLSTFLKKHSDKNAEDIEVNADASADISDINMISGEAACNVINSLSILAIYDTEYTEDTPAGDFYNVSVKIPYDYIDAENISVAYVSDNGTVECYNCEVTGRTATFKTTHLSQYILMGKLNSSAPYIAFTMIAVFLGCAFFVITITIRVKRSKAEKQK